MSNPVVEYTAIMCNILHMSNGDQEVDALPAVLAANFKALRKRRSLTFDDIAAKSGVSKSMLVQIEKGANPSIGTLWKIANAFGCTVSRLIDPPAPVEFQKIKLAEATNLWTDEDASEARLLFGLEGNDLVEFWQWRLAPGAEHTSAAHPTGAKEIVSVLTGSLDIHVAGMRHKLRANETARFEADAEHVYANTSQRPVTFSMVVVEPKTGGDQK